MKNEIYNVDYFIKKFEAIPEDKWIVDSQGGINQSDPHCALGHCVNKLGFYGNSNPEDSLFEGALFAFSKEANSLQKLFGGKRGVTAKINNGYHKRYKQPTPKQRILAALYDIKKLETPYQVTHLYIPHIVKIDESILIEVNEN